MKTKTIAKQALLVASLLFSANQSNFLNAQNIGINSLGTSPAASAGLDVDFTNKGFLAPRVALTALNAASPIISPATSLLVYNTATAGIVPNNVYPGYYYWNGAAWTRFATGENWKITGNSNITNFNFLGTTNAQSLFFVTDNLQRMAIRDNGQIAVNTSSIYTTSVLESRATGVEDALVGVASGTGNAVYARGTGTGDAMRVVGAAHAIVASTSAFNKVGIYGVNTSPSNSTGIVGIGNNSSMYTTGVYGNGVSGTASGTGYGVIGSHYNAVDTKRYGVLGTPQNGVYGQYQDSIYGWIASAKEGLYVQNFSTLFGAIAQVNGTDRYGLLGSATGGTRNAGLYVNRGETVITNLNSLIEGPAGMPRSWDGSIFTKSEDVGARIYFRTNGVNYFINRSGAGDYSEYFKTTDKTLGVGEIVALDPENANGVRRARPSDVSKTVGIVSFGGTRNNDSSQGDRHGDPEYVNVGLLGQVPVLISLENGNIKPGDALTISKTYRGRVAKATEACRIIGYALTNFPYVAGEQTYEIDINGTDKLKLKQDHVMCFINPGWYVPADASLTDGVEPAAVESAFDMIQRVNAELSAERPIIENESMESLQKQTPIKVKSNKAEEVKDEKKEIIVIESIKPTQN